jgi:sulfatase maturation enzyme AslB (radical SAM superfamily)
MKKIWEYLAVTRDKAELWAMRKFVRLWFSRWRQKRLVPVLRSRLFRAVFRGRPDARPNFAQLLFQRGMGTALRSPKMLLALFRQSLRVCITYRCNLSCEACYAKGLQQEVGRADMSVEDFDRLTDHALNLGWRKVRFLGGEPTIHPDFPEMLDICYRKRIDISMPTNNLFPEAVGRRLDPRYIRDFAINYSAYLGGTPEQRLRFRANLDLLRERGVPFSFSYILRADGNDAGLEELYRDLEEYMPLYIRVSLELPAFADDKFKFELAEAGKTIFRRVHDMLVRCTKMYMPFYIYRPMPLCLFTAEQEMQLSHYSRYVFYTRCPLTFPARHGYGVLVTVNPDLSIFPCASVFIKGPNILGLKDRSAIHEFYAEKLKPLFTRPLAEACGDCTHHGKFMAAVNRKNLLAPAQFNDREMCQGGCISLRCHEGPGGGCHNE